MKTVFDVPAARLIAETAGKLKEKPEMKPPKWIGFVKAGPGNERAPEQPDFWYVRCASMLRQIYVNGPLGVSNLRKHYGTQKKHTVARKHKMKAGGNIIRKALQAMEKASLIEHKKEGRVIAAKGKALLDGIAKTL